jgi:hypothetical protein
MIGVEKRHVVRGEKYLLERGRGINIIFGPKYGPLQKGVSESSQTETYIKLPKGRKTLKSGLT